MNLPKNRSAETAAQQTVRLQKFLSHAGVCSRRHAERYILDGRVRVNGQVVSRLGTKVNPKVDRVSVDGRTVSAEKDRVYIVLHKPAGVVTSCSHPGESVVTELVDLPQRVYPVGRLDKESTGLLLLTNDGGLHHVLSHPSHDHEKEYEVTVSRPIGDAELDKMRTGLPMMGRRTRPAEIKRISARRFRIVLKEGRNRQIRRMVRKIGNRVTRLKRIRMANVTLGGLEVGKWRHLSRKEVRELLRESR
jgi:23S rRNA pseudouridine2605 synthase/23S rRNA pseudouridine2604 synthase